MKKPYRNPEPGDRVEIISDGKVKNEGVLLEIFALKKYR